MLVRRLDYYDLIELPNGRHVPVPIAIEAIGIRNVLKIPIAKEVRDDQFYWCNKCAELYPLYEGSFFKCTWHNPESEKENEEKISILKRLVNQGEFKKLKYIVSTSTGGYIFVNKEGKIVGRSFWFPVDKWQIPNIEFDPKFTLCNLKPRDKRGIWYEPIYDYYRRRAMMIIIVGFIILVAVATYLFLMG